MRWDGDYVLGWDLPVSGAGLPNPATVPFSAYFRGSMGTEAISGCHRYQERVMLTAVRVLHGPHGVPGFQVTTGQASSGHFSLHNYSN